MSCQPSRHSKVVTYANIFMCTQPFNTKHCGVVKKKKKKSSIQGGSVRRMVWDLFIYFLENACGPFSERQPLFFFGSCVVRCPLLNKPFPVRRWRSLRSIPKGVLTARRGNCFSVLRNETSYCTFQLCHSCFFYLPSGLPEVLPVAVIVKCHN